MLDQNDIKIIAKTAEEFFQKMTISVIEIETKNLPQNLMPEENKSQDASQVIELNIKIDDPQILIGQNGQTLLEIQRILKILLNKKLQKLFYLNLDINDYKKKKIEYLEDLAKDLADEVALTKKEKELFPMPAYERRIIHTELSQRTDVITESQGEGLDRHIVIKPVV